MKPIIFAITLVIFGNLLSASNAFCKGDDTPPPDVCVTVKLEISGCDYDVEGEARYQKQMEQFQHLRGFGFEVMLKGHEAQIIGKVISATQCESSGKVSFEPEIFVGMLRNYRYRAPDKKFCGRIVGTRSAKIYGEYCDAKLVRPEQCKRLDLHSLD